MSDSTGAVGRSPDPADERGRTTGGLAGDRTAVSPVIGVILMVAITVILAAVIGTFLLGIGQNQQTSPQAHWTFDYNRSVSALYLNHEGGDSFTQENTGKLRVVVDPPSGPPDSGIVPDAVYPISAGDRLPYPDPVDPGSTVRIVWESPSGDRTTVVATYDVPA